MRARALAAGAARGRAAHRLRPVRRPHRTAGQEGGRSGWAHGRPGRGVPPLGPGRPARPGAAAARPAAARTAGPGCRRSWTTCRTPDKVVFLTYDDGAERDPRFVDMVRELRLPVSMFLTDSVVGPRVRPLRPAARGRREHPEPHPRPPRPARPALRRPARRDLRPAGQAPARFGIRPRLLPPALRHVRRHHPARRRRLRHRGGGAVGASTARVAAPTAPAACAPATSSPWHRGGDGTGLTERTTRLLREIERAGPDGGAPGGLPLRRGGLIGPSGV